MTTNLKLTTEAAAYAEEKLRTGAFASLDVLVNAALLDQAKCDTAYQEHRFVEAAMLVEHDPIFAPLHAVSDDIDRIAGEAVD